MKYHLNESLLNQSRQILENRKNIYCIVGGSCSGKVQLAKQLLQNMECYTMTWMNISLVSILAGIRKNYTL